MIDSSLTEDERRDLEEHLAQVRRYTNVDDEHWALLESNKTMYAQLEASLRVRKAAAQQSQPLATVLPFRPRST